MDRFEQEQLITVKEWLITLLILAIPIINIVMVFVWAFGEGAKSSKANFFKALLIAWLIAIGVGILLFVSFGTALNGYNVYYF